MKALILLFSLTFLASCGRSDTPSGLSGSVDVSSQISGLSASEVANTGSIIEQTLSGTLK